MYVAGVYKNDGPFDAFVDVSKIRELYEKSTTTPLKIGGGVSLTDLHEVLSTIGSSNPDYVYASTLAEHIAQIGSLPVRNVS